METNGQPGQLTDEWVSKHFDHLSPQFARELHPTTGVRDRKAGQIETPCRRVAQCVP